MDNIKFELGQSIRSCRKKKNITQKELALLVGTKQDYISKLENGMINITVDSLSDIASALKCDIRKILKVFS